jgi:hypothetical protein
MAGAAASGQSVSLQTPAGYGSMRGDQGHVRVVMAMVVVQEVAMALHYAVDALLQSAAADGAEGQQLPFSKAFVAAAALAVEEQAGTVLPVGCRRICARRADVAGRASRGGRRAGGVLPACQAEHGADGRCEAAGPAQPQPGEHSVRCGRILVGVCVMCASCDVVVRTDGGDRARFCTRPLCKTRRPTRQLRPTRSEPSAKERNE